MPDDRRPLLTPGLKGWHMAGSGGFRWAAEGVVESYGGPGLLWYADEAFDDFVLSVEWRLSRIEDNSGVFLRCPPLADDIRPAIERGYEVQIDDRGRNPEADRLGDPLHRTGAIYKLAPAIGLFSRPVGAWNAFAITASGSSIAVQLNGRLVSRLDNAARNQRGHIALQAHHEGSAVQFRALEVRPLRGGSAAAASPCLRP